MGRKLSRLERAEFYREWSENHTHLDREDPQHPITETSAREMLADRFGSEALALMDEQGDHPLWNWAKDATQDGWEFADRYMTEDELEITRGMRREAMGLEED